MSSQLKLESELFEFAKILGHQTDYNEVLRIVAHKSAQFLKADLTLVLMLNPDTRETVKTIIKNGKSIDQREYREIRINVGGWVINNGKSFISENIQNDERFGKGFFDNVPIKSVAGVPLIIEGIIIGALILLYHETIDLSNTTTIEYLENIASISVPYLRNVQKIKQYFQTSMSESSLILKYENVGLFGKSTRFVELLQSIEAATKFDVRILLVGRTGTGKELIARAIHKFSSRNKFPFIAVDCGAIPNNLLESELFGHRRGAFTGADTNRQGLFLEADGGTLFMDEINNLPYEMQSKLLRVLEEGEIRPIGSDRSFKTNVRIITASSAPLKKLVESDRFREDLFYRLHVYPIYIPDLVDRQEDIPILADHFLHYYAKQQNKNIQKLHEFVIDFIKQKNWEGNIRELENFIERIVTLTPIGVSSIEHSYFPKELQNEIEDFKLKVLKSESSTPIKEQMNKYEAELIKQALIECEWNQSKAARKLHTSESNIRYKMSQYDIHKDERK
ncbi:MAG: sigma-54-dependent Fis family transcriptional regulator [Ignavibacterium sp.]|nr:MAG: sigma-54-dependent Fis family transcriptional regulator [Ignavibacterium sp.]